MRIWFALLAVPLLALADQSVSYVTAVWACDHQNTLVVHGTHVPFLIAAVVGTALAWQRWRRSSPMKAENETLARRHFVAGLATGLAGLSVLVILAMWAVTWVLRSCVY
jgi:branched-subunit amino acid transport protein